MPFASAITDLLNDMARHQQWADATHWKTLHENAALLENASIRKTLNHILHAIQILTARARGESPDMATFTDIEDVAELESAMTQAHADLLSAIGTLDHQRLVAFPRGPKGPWETPAGELFLQAILHGQHHRGQIALRMREHDVKPPMTDYIIWCAFGKPATA
jgi:uncharacterized damage-inducible protein DinB